ncbi:hypothetical protein BT96DRAFT_559409 [Gymnopus androsaceus JB14]|uniref:Uncharacterized protein n=1 Tax=Gymnopus androsaceus JB14 TaxID=1447944 RepID=A0A6A4HWS4_9AGAR|nr:hypothetical protein BT96DRAFT_559409 [Gymnopus androsaceus JB14]
MAGPYPHVPDGLVERRSSSSAGEAVAGKSAHNFGSFSSSTSLSRNGQSLSTSGLEVPSGRRSSMAGPYPHVPDGLVERRSSSSAGEAVAGKSAHNFGPSSSSTSLSRNGQSLSTSRPEVPSGRRSSMAGPYPHVPDGLVERQLSAMSLTSPKANIPRSQSQDNLGPSQNRRNVHPSSRAPAEAGSDWGSRPTSAAPTDAITSASRFKSSKAADSSTPASRPAESQYRTGSSSSSSGALPIYSPGRTLNNTTSPRMPHSNSYGAPGMSNTHLPSREESRGDRSNRTASVYEMSVHGMVFCKCFSDYSFSSRCTGTECDLLILRCRAIQTKCCQQTPFVF